LTNSIDSWTLINHKSTPIIAVETNSNKSLKFKSISECSQKLFGNCKEAANISKHMKRNTSYKNYIFKRDI
jgi:hypothetical protein